MELCPFQQCRSQHLLQILGFPFPINHVVSVLVQIEGIDEHNSHGGMNIVYDGVCGGIYGSTSLALLGMMKLGRRAD